MKNVIRCKDYSKRKVPPPYSGAGEAAAMLWKDGHLRMNTSSAGKLFRRMTDALAMAGDEGRGKPR